VQPRDAIRPLRHSQFEPEKEPAVGWRSSAADGAKAPRGGNCATDHTPRR